jgi:threonine aldolase
MIELRSDTMTKPTPGMRKAMAEAEVGDDVFGEDPTVNALQERAAELLGKEKALFVTSGTMANQVAIRSHTRSGDEIICHRTGHTYNAEGGGWAVLSGCSSYMLDTPDGMFDGEDIREAVRPDNPHYAHSRIVIMENTQGLAGGLPWPLERVADVAATSHELGLAVHTDGARLMNACIAMNCSPSDYTKHLDSVTLCFSKGLGAPVGSVVAGDGDFIHEALRARKMFGGGMRQAGVIAAGALYAIENNIERLAEDHANAKALATRLAEMRGVRLDPEDVPTNIVIFELADHMPPAPEVSRALKAVDVLVGAMGPRKIRAVAHLGVSAKDIEESIPRFASVLDN